MAPRRPNWQPSLDLGLPATKRELEQTRVEYDKPAREVREQVFQQAPPPRPAKAAAAESPWWDRAQKVVGQPRTPTPLASFGNAWRGLLREEGWTTELPASHAAMLEATVRGLEVRPGVVEAGVGVGRERPQRVQLRLAPFSPAEWARVVRRVVDAGGLETLLSELEAGKVPLPLLDACDACGLTLAPRRLSLVIAACTCGGARLPCDHVLAIHLSVARQLGYDPLSLVTFRGAPTEALRALVDRVREEAGRVAVAPSQGPSDPFAAGGPLAIDWSVLAAAPALRAPLPPMDGWRASETFDALVRRLLAAARSPARGPSSA